MPHHEIAGKIIIEAMIVSIGVSIGTAQLGGSEGKQESDSDSQDQDSKSSEQRPHVLGQLILAYCGATIFAANIAPTEEIVIVAIESKPWKLIGLAVLSILIGALILQYSSFIGAEQTWSSGGAFFKLLEPVASYAAALLASAMML